MYGLCRYLDSVTLTYILHSINFYTFYITLPYVLNYKAFNIQTPALVARLRRPTGDQEVAGSIPAEVGNILSWRLIMKYFLRSFSPFRLIQEGQLSVSGERMSTILVNCLED